MKRLKSNEKGFTLVELIVVMVIISILAAILVPALLSYIDKAKEKQMILNAKSVLTAAQVEMTSLYSQDFDGNMTSAQKQEIIDLAEVPYTNIVVGTAGDAGALNASSTIEEKHAAFTVNYIYYECTDGKIWFDGSAWTLEKPDIKPVKVYNVAGAEPAGN
jgi:prepilin-type N-terminal cleavage/methylation domain-containing protein